MTYSVSGWVKGWLAPVYERAGQALPYIIIALIILLVLRIMRKALKKSMAKKSQRKEEGSTNDWFDWNKYKEWQNKRQKNQS